MDEKVEPTSEGFRYLLKQIILMLDESGAPLSVLLTVIRIRNLLKEDTE
ncbi:MAG: hypothetical protein NC299_12900 [Lachnospiraceae bacterium]|nr:hypothetical protein [Ruminococcus sp.]MCM1276236.1 hypothetical protein [Lachnospiraceae bacterium]